MDGASIMAYMLLAEEILLIASSSLAGVLSAIALGRISKIKKSSSAKNREKLMKTSDAAKSELQSLLFEKSLASEAIAHSYEAAQKRKIDLAERNKLLLKYRQQISFYNKKIEELQSVADLVELSQGRDRLVSLIETKITAIDSKLFELSQRLGISLEAFKRHQTNFVKEESLPHDLATPPDVTVKTSTPKDAQIASRSIERSIGDMQEEVIKALAGLEKARIDDNRVFEPKTGETISGTTPVAINVKRDALANLYSSQIEV